MSVFHLHLLFTMSGSLLVTGRFKMDPPKAMVSRHTKAEQELVDVHIYPCLVDPKEVPSAQAIKKFAEQFHTGELFSKCATINATTEQEVALDDLFEEEPVNSKRALEKKPAASERKKKPATTTSAIEKQSREFNKQIAAADMHTSVKKAPPKKRVKKDVAVEEPVASMPLMVREFVQSILNEEIEAVEACGMEMEKDDTVEEFMQRNSDQFASIWMFSNYIKERF